MKSSIGERIKFLRTDKGMTLASLCEKVNLSKSYLSQIERDRTNPSLTTLMNIAKAFDIDPRYFFESGDDTTLVQRADQVFQSEIITPEIIRYPLSPINASNTLQAYKVVIKPHSPPQAFDTYSGEEMCFVLFGELTVVSGDETYVLKLRDSIHYDAQFPHSWSNRSSQECEFIWSRASY